jgi:hypothetical protein
MTEPTSHDQASPANSSQAKSSAGDARAKDKRIKTVFLAATIIVAALIYLLVQTRPSKVSSWPQDAEAQVAAAKKDGRPVVLVFMSDVADATSEHMAKKSLNEPLVLKALTETSVHYAMVVTNLRNPPPLAKEYKITKLPTVLKLSPAGRELKRREDFIGEPDLARFIKDAP